MNEKFAAEREEECVFKFGEGPHEASYILFAFTNAGSKDRLSPYILWILRAHVGLLARAKTSIGKPWKSSARKVCLRLLPDPNPVKRACEPAA